MVVCLGEVVPKLDRLLVLGDRLIEVGKHLLVVRDPELVMGLCRGRQIGGRFALGRRRSALNGETWSVKGKDNQRHNDAAHVPRLPAMVLAARNQRDLFAVVASGQ